MKKKLMFVMIPLTIFLLFWIGSFFYFEVLTYKYANYFIDLYKLSNMIDKVDYLKVIRYSEHDATIYYVTENTFGNLFIFKKINGEWVLDQWETVWSKYGSADGYIWPYIR